MTRSAVEAICYLMWGQIGKLAGKVVCFAQTPIWCGTFGLPEQASVEDIFSDEYCAYYIWVSGRRALLSLFD